MKATKLLICGLITFAVFTFSVSAIASPEASKGEHSVKAIAKILSHVNHFPSASEKKTLKKIAGDSSSPEHIRVIATAVSNMQHSVGSDDKSKLQAIAGDHGIDDDARTIASILINFSHKPSKADKKKLGEILE